MSTRPIQVGYTESRTEHSVRSESCLQIPSDTRHAFSIKSRSTFTLHLERLSPLRQRIKRDLSSLKTFADINAPTKPADVLFMNVSSDFATCRACSTLLGRALYFWRLRNNLLHYNNRHSPLAPRAIRIIFCVNR